MDTRELAVYVCMLRSVHGTSGRRADVALMVRNRGDRRDLDNDVDGGRSRSLKR